MAGGNKPALPLGPAPGTFAGDQHRAIQREMERSSLAIRQLREGRIANRLALDAAPTTGQWAQGDVVLNNAPRLSISASATFVVWGWQYVNEGSGTLSWAELRWWQSMATPGGTFNAASQTATNIGAGVGVYEANDGTTLRFRTLVEGAGISITVTGSIVRIVSTVTQNTWTAASMTATHTGSGESVYVGNTGSKLNFRRLQEGANISLTLTNGAIRITSVGGGLTAASITATTTGSGESVYAGNSGTELVFRNLQEGTGISLTQSAGALKITATRYGSQIGTYGWRDNLSALSAARAAGGNQPAWGTIRDGLQGWLFPPVGDTELWVSFHIDHDYATGTALFPHIHVVPLDNTGGVTRWGIEYSFAKGHNQAAFGASSTIYLDGTITANSQYRHYIFETSTISAISGVGIETDGVLLCRIFRNAADPGDTFSTTVAAIFADLHYQTDHIATVEKSPAFTALSWNGDTTIGGFLATSQTATSTGTGVSVYVGNAAGELTLRKVQAGTGVSITTSGGAIRITSTGGGFTAASMTATHTGSGEGIYVGNTGTKLNFRRLQEGTGISLTLSAGAIRITSTATGGPATQTWVGANVGTETTEGFVVSTVTLGDLAQRVAGLISELRDAGILSQPPNLWNSIDKGAVHTLSTNGLTLFNSSASWGLVRGNRKAFSGKRYFEFVIDTLPSSNYVHCGVAAASHADNFLGSGATGWALAGNATKWTNFSSAGYGATFWVTGNVIGVLLDFTGALGVLNFTLNGTTISTVPCYSSISVTVHPAMSLYNGAQITARFSSTSWAYAPTGYTEF